MLPALKSSHCGQRETCSLSHGLRFAFLGQSFRLNRTYTAGPREALGMAGPAEHPERCGDVNHLPVN